MDILSIKWHNYTEWQSCVSASTAGVVEALEDRDTGSAACCVGGGGAVAGGGSGALRRSQPPSGQLQVLREGGQQSSGRSCTGAQSWRGLTRLASMNWGQSEGEVGSRPMAWNLQRVRPSPTRLASSHVSFCRTACSPLSFWNTGGGGLKYNYRRG